MSLVSGEHFYQAMYAKVAGGGPCLALLGWDGRCYLATDAEEVAWAEHLARPLCDEPRTDGISTKRELTWPAYVGLISYDEFNPWAVQREPSRLFWVRKVMTAEHDDVRRYVRSLTSGIAGWSLSAHTGEDHYLQQVAAIIAAIKTGRFYQLNYLRYFDVVAGEEHDAVAQRCARLVRHGGDMAAVIMADAIDLWSFSPERFVQTHAAAGETGLYARTFPIKGTAGAGNNLGASQKDQAELNMIVDLMRNDLQQVSAWGSVKVESAGELLQLPSVTHRVARICSRLHDDLTLGEFLRALCPGGSITGAPKREVMLAIRECEDRERGYFMGNVFHWQPTTGAFDSNILIRTMWRKAAQNPYGYAAGSGIVIGSQAAAELEEVGWKCRVLTRTAAD